MIFIYIYIYIYIQYIIYIYIHCFYCSTPETKQIRKRGTSSPATGLQLCSWCCWKLVGHQVAIQMATIKKHGTSSKRRRMWGPNDLDAGQWPWDKPESLIACLRICLVDWDYKSNSQLLILHHLGWSEVTRWLIKLDHYPVYTIGTKITRGPSV